MRLVLTKDDKLSQCRCCFRMIDSYQEKIEDKHNRIYICRLCIKQLFTFLKDNEVRIISL